MDPSVSPRSHISARIQQRNEDSGFSTLLQVECVLAFDSEEKKRKQRTFFLLGQQN
jgi:hypothetical protein